MSEQEWRTAQQEHANAADELTAGWRSRRPGGIKHPVDDFLFVYYAFRPGQLRRWHPGAGVILLNAPQFAEKKFYRPRPEHGPDAVEFDVAAFAQRRASGLQFWTRLLSAVAGRQGHFGCFGLHEWAMVYRAQQQDVRHDWPLRLGGEGTDAVVEAHQIRCSHFDAYRFFTPDAAPRNTLRPTRERQVDLDQPGCLHAGMDCYKAAYTMTPLVPGDVLLDAFRLARDIRTLDMEASPYDLRDLGLDPLRIETPEGKAEYVRRQKGFTQRSQAMRARLLEALRPAADLLNEAAPSS